MSPLVLVLGIVAVAVATGLDRMATKVLRPIPRKPDRLIAGDGFTVEPFKIDAGGSALASWLLKPGTEARAPLIILAHGWGASSGTVMRLGAPLVRLGFTVLLYDVRGHGANPPRSYVTVKNFRDDLQAVVAYAAGRFPGRPLVVVGHSLGGAAAILACADGMRADALVLIATPSDVMKVTSEFLTDHGMPGALIVYGLRPFFWRRVGGSFRQLTPTRRLPEVTVPFLMLQPEHDQRVQRYHADRLAAAAGQAYVLIEDCEHTDVLERSETLRQVDEFVRELGLGG